MSSSGAHLKLPGLGILLGDEDTSLAGRLAQEQQGLNKNNDGASLPIMLGRC